MKLNDFLYDDDLNRLRSLMTVSHLGHYEHFDPNYQITFAEREALNQEGLMIAGDKLFDNSQRILRYKNLRVLALDSNNIVHFSICESLKSKACMPCRIAINTAFLVEHQSEMGRQRKNLKLCENCICLHQMFNGRRRHRHNSLACEKLEFNTLARELQLGSLT